MPTCRSGPAHGSAWSVSRQEAHSQPASRSHTQRELLLLLTWRGVCWSVVSLSLLQGLRFALMEMVAVLAVMLKTVNMAPLHGDQPLEVRWPTTIQFKDSVPMVFNGPRQPQVVA